MAFKQFRFNIVLRVLLLTATCLALFITLNSTFTFTPILVAALIIYQVWSLIRYVDRTNRELAGFLESIRYSEFTRTFQISDGGSSFDELNEAFNDVMKDFQQVRSEREEHFHYLQSIVQDIDVSILAYQRDGTVEMINPAAKNKRNYWVGGEAGADAERWFETAEKVPGSWWTHWSEWLEPKAGEKITARSKLGNTQYPVIEEAPGRYVKVRHGGSYSSVYMHLSRIAEGVRTGAEVRQGQLLGYVGKTGNATGYHLHYGLMQGGRYVDPIRLQMPAADPVRNRSPVP